MLSPSSPLFVFKLAAYLIRKTRILCKFYTRLARNEYKLFKSNLKFVRNAMHDLPGANIELGLKHFKAGKTDDAIFRFGLADFLDNRKNIKAKYWLAISYTLKGNYQKALKHFNFNGVNELDSHDITAFVHKLNDSKDNNQITEIPDNIYSFFRDVTADYHENRFDGFIDLFHLFSRRMINDIFHTPLQASMRKHIQPWQIFNKEPKNDDTTISMLEIGINYGILNYKTRLFLSKKYHITGTEISPQLVQQEHKLFYDFDNYNQINNNTLNQQLIENKTDDKYHIITSFNGFSYKKDLSEEFKTIHRSLKDGGYFAFAVSTHSTNKGFCPQIMEFIYDESEIFDSLKSNHFDIISFKTENININDPFLPAKNNPVIDRNYSIYICRKA